MKIIITGANGQLGNQFREIAGASPQHNFLFLSRQELSVSDPAAVQEVLSAQRADWCINCAAYTAVDKAENERDEAMRVNGEATGILAKACAAAGTRFIHISTDYVFDGTASVPYREDDITGPISVYGRSKLRGEELALQYDPRSIIIRTSWVYSAYGHNFVKTMVRLMKEHDKLNVVNDQYGSPTYAGDLAQAILHIIESPAATAAKGIFNYSNEGQTTWYEFAVAIKELTGSQCNIHPIPTDQYPTLAKRPQYSMLDKTKIRSTFNLIIPCWKDSLKACLHKLN